MRLILIIASIGCVLACLVQPVPGIKATIYSLNNINNDWTQFKLKYYKKYQNLTRENLRYIYIYYILNFISLILLLTYLN